MQKTVYYCDHCKEIIGKVLHVSLQVHGFGNTTGIAVPVNTSWKVVGFERQFMHLHVKCATPFFKELGKKAEEKFTQKKVK